MNPLVSPPLSEIPRADVLVVGGGIAGLTAAVEAAECGCQVVLIEREGHLGGRVAQMHQYFPKLCPPLCGLELNLRHLRGSSKVACFTLTEVHDIAQQQGALHVTALQQPRFVTENCSACGACAKVCPASRPSSFDFGLGGTEAIYLPYAAAYPSRYIIDPSVCTGLDCARCVSACPQSAIDLSMTPRQLEFIVRTVIWATGWEPYNPRALEELGFGAHPDVITNVMLERLASPQGPTSGRIVCPSNGREPQRVAFVQCAGSRDQNHLDYCSGVCCLASAKQARYVRAAIPDADISICYIDRRTAGNGERFLAVTAEDPKIHFVLGKVAKVATDGATPVIEFENVQTQRRVAEPMDLVVLATGMVPTRSDTPAACQLARDAHGFLLEEQPSLAQIVAGSARQPMDVSTTVRDATSAVARALAYCRRGSAPHEPRRTGGAVESSR